MFTSEIEAKVITPLFRVWYIATITDLEMISRRVIVSKKGGHADWSNSFVEDFSADAHECVKVKF